MDSIIKRLHALELLKKTRFGIVTEIDNEGTASWNTKQWKPAARVVVQDTSEVEITCRLESIGSGKNEGLWWPLKTGAVVRVAFQRGIDSGVITGRLWSDDQSDLPSEARTDGDNVVLKYAGHTFIVDGKAGDGGITLQTASGILVDMQDKTGDQKVTIHHPTGTEIIIDKDGNLTITVKGNLTAEVTGNAEIDVGGNLKADVDGNVEVKVGGNIDVEAQGTAMVYAHGGVTIKADTQITLQTLTALGGILTQLTHPVCMLMGVPNGASATVKGSA